MNYNVIMNTEKLKLLVSKKLPLTLSLIFCLVAAKAQLTYEHQYDSGSNYGYLIHPVHFSSHGYKYVMINSSTMTGMIEIYNLNHTLYKQFAIPAQPNAIAQLDVFYVSDSLFNTNPTNFEYLLEYYDINSIDHVKIYDDAGNLIFTRDSVTATFDPMRNLPLFYTTNGYKLILEQQTPTNSKICFIYGLPGALPCDECVNSNVITAMQGPSNNNGNNGYLNNAYPNPAKHSVTIPYQLPEGINVGQIVFYDLQGKEIKQIPVGRAFTSIDVSVSEIAAGTYLYILRTSSGDVGSKKMVIIK